MAESFYGKQLKNIADKLKSKESKPKKESKKEAPEGSKEPKEKTKVAPKKSNLKFTIGQTNMDFTPAIYREAVHAREVKQRWILVNAGALALVLGGSGLIYFSGVPTSIELESKKQQSDQINQELQKYQDQNIAIDQQLAIQNKLNQATGGAVAWESLISSIEGNLPSGTSIGSIGANVDANSQERSVAVVMNFVSNSPLGYADTLRAVENAPGVSNVQIGGMTSSGEDAYMFAATMDYGISFRTNRFSPEANQKNSNQDQNKPKPGDLPKDLQNPGSLLDPGSLLGGKD